MRKIHCIAMVLLVVLAAASMRPPLKAQTAEKQIDKLIARAGDTIASIRHARSQIKTTVGDYNQILEGEAEDNRAAYKQLQKALGKSEKVVENVRSKADRMDLAANRYFTSWEDSLSEFSDEEMRARSEARITETREQYDGILQAGREAGDAFEQFVSQLNDQIVFLGHDLNPAAIEDLQDEAEKLNAQAKDLFTKVDQTMRNAMKYRSSLKPD